MRHFTAPFVPPAATRTSICAKTVGEPATRYPCPGYLAHSDVRGTLGVVRLANSAVLLSCLACGCGSNVTRATGAADIAGCSPGTALVGASYDLRKSRFAFGSTPVREDSYGFVRWVGAHGVVAIAPSGREMGVMNADAPETSVPDWSDDPSALAKHVTDYYVAMGASTCQVSMSQILADSGGGRTVALPRGVDGIPVSESIAVARFNGDDQSTSESFYWPEIGADIVDGARAFRDRLAMDAELAAYKAKLPADAQGDGQVVIHHNDSFSSAAFRASVSYDVRSSQGGEFGRGLSFDADGNPVSTSW